MKLNLNTILTSIVLAALAWFGSLVVRDHDTLTRLDAFIKWRLGDTMQMKGQQP